MENRSKVLKGRGLSCKGPDKAAEKKDIELRKKPRLSVLVMVREGSVY
jgi:hypothetical protein